MAAELIHYANKPVDRVRSTKQKEQIDKPTGLWISVEDGEGWREWCEGESFGLERLRCWHRVTLAPDARILRLTTVADIDRFTEQFGREQKVWPAHLGRYVRDIDWPLIAKAWQGIIVAPYQWERRLHVGCAWYYGWDCSSGCIWDAAAVASIDLIRSDYVAKKEPMEVADG